MDHSTWLLGNGGNIHFWSDKWCGPPFNLFLNDDKVVDDSILVRDYIIDHRWNLPTDFAFQFPHIWNLVQQVTIPEEDIEDELVWLESSNGKLSFKDAYIFIDTPSQCLQWARCVWSPNIPPSKSLLVWRVMNDKVLVDEKLREKGCALPSACTLCMATEETAFHLFFECSYVVHLWCWLASILSQPLHFLTFEEIWSLRVSGWSPQCSLSITSAAINIFSAIWQARNLPRFQNKKFHWKSAISHIIANVSLSASNSNLPASSNIKEFSILKAFNVSINPSRLLLVKEVLWCPPLPGWIKGNCDGAFASGKASCGVIFRNKFGQFMGAFAEGLNFGNSLFAELSGAMRSIEFAKSKNWNSFWLETDSKLVVQTFSNQDIVPWQLRNRGSNCLRTVSNMNFIISHIYREDNACADTFANIGLTLNTFVYYYSLPIQIRSDYIKNRLGWPNFRFNHS